VNSVHGLICSSRWWARTVESELLPWALKDVDLGGDVLEIGPGFGATTTVLAARCGALSVLELDERYCERLRANLHDRVEVRQGDATAMPYPDGRFSAVLAFTMLHHVPTPALQDRLFVEVARVLAPGGVFAGSDSIGTGVVFRMLHVRDTLVAVDPDELPERLAAAGLVEARAQPGGRSFRFRARKAGVGV
jgi:SAM-dependent methyltransferase